MWIDVHDEVLLGSLPESCGPRYMEAAVEFARLLRTAYQDTLKAKYPEALVSVHVSAQMLRGFEGGLRVEMECVPGVGMDEPEIVEGLLLEVRDLAWRRWLDPTLEARKGGK